MTKPGEAKTGANLIREIIVSRRENRGNLWKAIADDGPLDRTRLYGDRYSLTVSVADCHPPLDFAIRK